MDDKQWYQGWFNSPFYHKLYFERDEKEAEGFINQLIQHLKIPSGSRILDMACGRGRHSKYLANAGFEVTGIDLSASSIDYALKEIQQGKDNPEFFVHDMRLPFRGNYFDITLNLFTSFGYFRTKREHDDVIRTVANGLKPGGMFIIDYMNVHYAESHLIHNEIKTYDNTIYEIHRWDDETHFYKKITISDSSLTNPLVYTEVVAKFSLGDFNDMLSYQGMQVKEVFGDYNLGGYDVKSTPRLILIASKL